MEKMTGGDDVKNTNCTCGGTLRFAGRHTLTMDMAEGVRPPFGIGSELRVDLYICEECHEIKWYAVNGEESLPDGKPDYGDMLAYSDRALCAVIDDPDNTEETKTLARKLLLQRYPPRDEAGEPIESGEIEHYCTLYRRYSTAELQTMYADRDYPAAMHEALGRLLGEREPEAVAKEEKRSRGKKQGKDPWDL